MKKNRSHEIIHTYLDRHDRLKTRVNSGLHGATDEQARYRFEQHIKFAQNAADKGLVWNGTPVRIIGIVLIDAAQNVLGEWTADVKAKVA